MYVKPIDLNCSHKRSRVLNKNSQVKCKCTCPRYFWSQRSIFQQTRNIADTLQRIYLPKVPSLLTPFCLSRTNFDLFWLCFFIFLCKRGYRELIFSFLSILLDIFHTSWYLFFKLFVQFFFLLFLLDIFFVSFLLSAVSLKTEDLVTMNRDKLHRIYKHDKWYWWDVLEYIQCIFWFFRFNDNALSYEDIFT